MKKYKNLLFYAVIVGGLAVFTYVLILLGSSMEAGRNVQAVAAEGSAWQNFMDAIGDNLKYPLAILLLQIIAIILVARVVGFFFRKIGQPSVIGEIVAGILLGPSLVGHYFPEFSAFLFPASSLSNLGVLSQMGLILFMFVVGMELDLNILKKKAHEAVVISHASIVFPFALGVGLAYFIYQQTAPENVSFLSYALFIGISLSITAFPVLARIVQERGLTKTRLGSIVITCAAADDITAWCLLAAVIAIVKAGNMGSAAYTILFAILYVVFMFRFVRPFLKRIGDLHANKEALSKPIVGVFFVTLLLSSWATEVIGIHALFGAFMAGVIMPTNVSFRNIFIEKVEDVALVLLLPLFFVFTGLRTEIGLLSEPGLWQLCLIVIAVAVIGKFVGSAVAARYVGQSWHDSLTIGALMNTRGLMELVALNIGYDLGVLSPEMFAILVLMALVTTFMTGPSLDLINKFFPKRKDNTDLSHQRDKYNVLISFGNPLSGRSLMRLANMFTRKSTERSTVTALHLSLGNELNHFNSVEYERDSFRFIAEEAERVDQRFIPVFRPAQDINAEIVEIANKGDFDLALVGIGQSVFEGTVLGKILGFTSKVINPEKLLGTITGKEGIFATEIFDERTTYITRSIQIPVGVFIDKGLDTVDRVLVPISNHKDLTMLTFIQRLVQNTQVLISIVDNDEIIQRETTFKEGVRALQFAAPNQIEVIHEQDFDEEFLASFELLLVSLDSWIKLLESRTPWLSDTPSVLIVKP